MIITADPRLHEVRRPGYSLIELVVTLAIILIITAMVSAVAVQVMAYQRGSITQTTLKVLNDSLDRQWRAVVDSARREARSISQDTHLGIYNIASWRGENPSVVNQNIDKRAQIIYVKLRLKQEFPMNFSEALYPAGLPRKLYLPSPPYPMPRNAFPPRPAYGNLPSGNPLTFSNSNPPRGVLRNAKIYVPSALEHANIYPPGFNPGINPVPASTDPQTWPIESSACILLSLQQGRGGPALTEDDLGSSALMTDPTTGLKLIVDAWQRPILFYRWQAPTPYSVDPAGNPGNQSNRDLDNSNPAGPYDPAAPKTVFRDPLDPEGVLLDPDWNNLDNYLHRAGVWWFEFYCHSVHEWPLGGPPNTYTPRAYYTAPTFVSTGRNLRRGLAQPYAPFDVSVYAAPPGLYPSPLLPDTMVIDPRDPEAANDNIYSYRLRQGARGN